MDINLKKIANELTKLQIGAADIHVHPDKYGITREIISKGEVVKGAKNDYTSRVDQVVETKLKPLLIKLVPDCGFLGEETESAGMEKRYRWIMDPTDGTAVYSLGGECYSNSTALIDRAANDGKGAIILGSVYQSATGKQFLMVNDTLSVREKAYFNRSGIIEKIFKNSSGTIERKPIPSQSKGFAEYLGCSFGTSFYYGENPGIEDRLKKVFEKQVVPLVDRPYNMLNARPASGSSALFCSEIADGKRHFALLFYQKAWDLAVGAVYAQRAGCPIVLFDNKGNVINQNLETSIAQCDMKTLINVGVFGNKYIRDDVLKKFNS